MGRLRTSIAFFYFAFLLSNADGASIKVSKFLAGNASAGTGGSQITRVFIDDDSRTVELQSGDHISVTAMTGLASDTVTVAGATGAGEITSFAKAQLGSLSVKLSGSVNGTNPPANYGRGEILLSTAKAGWQDSVRFESDQVPPGFILLFEGTSTCREW